jgi:CheY-like chemotaxis protein
VFIPFFTTKAGTGTGLGLAISRNTVSALGGEITLENRPEGGAVARVVLPAGEAEHEKHAASSGSDSPGTRRARVMVVDDELAICSTFERLLEDEHDVTTETSAKNAWIRIERGERFDVMFCDVMMPGMSGMELHQRLQHEAPDQAARIVFMTGGTFTQGATEYLERVPNLRLDKPCSARDIRQLVARLVRGSAVEGLAASGAP